MSGAKLPRPPAYRITLVQLAVLLVLGMALAGAAYPLVAESLVLGGLIAVLAQAYFAWRVFRHTGAQAAQRIARESYVGEIGKFFLAVAGFALIFALYRPLAAWAVFAGYGTMIIIQVLGSWLLLRQAAPHNRTKS
jgi:ATP synthase protein I